MGSAFRVEDSRCLYSLQDGLRIALDNVARIDPRSGAHAVHAARKDLKRARATLRLMRYSISDSFYHKANRQLRDAGRLLRPVRDVSSLLRALATIVKPTDNSGLRGYAKGVRHKLREFHRSALGRLTQRVCRSNANKVRNVNREALVLPIRQSEMLCTRRGLTKSYKKGREAFARAQHAPSISLLHEWRKQTKYLMNELKLTQTLMHPGLKKVRRRAREVSSTLGDDHDLALLRQKLREWDRANSAASRQRLERRIEMRRQKLQAKANRLGKKLYGDRPATFNQELKSLLL